MTTNILKEIKQGYTLVNGYVFKHFSIDDFLEINEKYQESLESLKSRNVKTKQEKLEEAIESGYWTELDIQNYKNIDKQISSAIAQKANAMIPQQKPIFQKTIDNLKNVKNELIFKLNVINYQSAEYYADTWIIRFQVFSSLYSDINLNKRLFSLEEFEELDDDEYDNILNCFNIFINKFQIEELKKLALNYSLRSLLELGDPFFIFNKPLIELTHFQSQLLILAKDYNNIINKYGSQIPRDILEKPEELEKWFEEIALTNQNNNKNSVDKNLLERRRIKK